MASYTFKIQKKDFDSLIIHKVLLTIIAISCINKDSASCISISPRIMIYSSN